MIALTLHGSTPAERGTQLGTEQKATIHTAVGLYLEYFDDRGISRTRVREIAESCFEALSRWAPHLAEETQAVASASGIELWQLAAINARTEILSVLPPENEGECSTAVSIPADHRAPQTVQTWDWHEFLCPTGHLIEYTPDRTTGAGAATGDTRSADDPGAAQAVTRVRLFTEPGVLGKIGVNDAGIGLHFNILHHTSDRGAGGVPVHAIARRVLDEAVSVDHAERIIRSASASASTVLTVSQSAPGEQRVASFEISPERVSVVRPNQQGHLVHTNHFIANDQLPGEATRDASTTYLRLDHLESQQSAMFDRPFVERAAGMCGTAGSQAPICMTPDLSQPPHEQWATLLTIGLDLAGFALEYYPGLPSELAKHGARRFK